MAHYTSRGGRLHHFIDASGLDEQVTTEYSYFVATSPQVFEGGEILAAEWYKPGVLRVLFKQGNTCRIIHTKPEFVPGEAMEKLCPKKP